MNEEKDTKELLEDILRLNLTQAKTILLLSYNRSMDSLKSQQLNTSIYKDCVERTNTLYSDIAKEIDMIHNKYHPNSSEEDFHGFFDFKDFRK